MKHSFPLWFWALLTLSQTVASHKARSQLEHSGLVVGSLAVAVGIGVCVRISGVLSTATERKRLQSSKVRKVPAESPVSVSSSSLPSAWQVLAWTTPPPTEA